MLERDAAVQVRQRGVRAVCRGTAAGWWPACSRRKDARCRRRLAAALQDLLTLGRLHEITVQTLRAEASAGGGGHSESPQHGQPAATNEPPTGGSASSAAAPAPAPAPPPAGDDVPPDVPLKAAQPPPASLPPPPRPSAPPAPATPAAPSAPPPPSLPPAAASAPPPAPAPPRFSTFPATLRRCCPPRAAARRVAGRGSGEQLRSYP